MLCPICKKNVEEREAGNKYFPFCSERCKLIDLGRWLGGKYQIPVTSDDEHAEGGGAKRSDEGLDTDYGA